MTTLNARANQAWTQITGDPDEVNYAFDHQRHSFEEGWETGYKAAEVDINAALEAETPEPVASPVADLNRAAVDKALRQVIEHADYDLHKSIEQDEETGEDNYAEHVDRFITEYGKAAS